jgi:hypothetical protein
MTVAILPSAFSTASMCWTNIRSAFLPFLRQPDGEAAGILDVLLDVVLAEGRVGEDAVEALQLAVLSLCCGAQGVLLADVGVGDAVQEHVHLADGPGGADALLAGEGEVARIAAALAT